MKYYTRYRARLRYPPLPLIDGERLWGKRLAFDRWTNYHISELAFGPLKWPIRHFVAVRSDDILIEGSDDDLNWIPVSRWWIDEARGIGATADGGVRGSGDAGEPYAWIMDELRTAWATADGEVALDQLAYHIHKHKAIANRALVVDILEAFGFQNLTEADLRDPLKRGARRIREGKRCYLCPRN